MRTSSCKAKGRRLQYLVRDAFRELGKQYGLEPDDIKSTPMGSSGVDVLLSPAAKRIFNVDVECKNRESISLSSVFWKHCETHKNSNGMKLLVHCKNHSKPTVTLKFEDFMVLFSKAIREV